MKKLLFLLFFLLFNSFLFAQVSPTLAVGLEKLTMNKGTIDVKVLTEIIISKQKELKQEALKRFMFKLFPEANFTTKYYVQNCLNVLLNEKNPQVIEKEVLELTTNYALSLGVTYAMMKSNDKQLFNTNVAYRTYKINSPYYQEIIIKEKRDEFKKEKSRINLNDSIHKYENKVKKELKNIDEINDEEKLKKLISYREKVSKYRKKMTRLTLRKNISNNDRVIIEEKHNECLRLINKISENNVLTKIDSAFIALSKIQNYIIENPKDKNILNIYHYLKDLDISAIEYKKLIDPESVRKTNIQGRKEDQSAKLKELAEKFKNLKNQYHEVPLEIPFGIILDVVSLSLSDIPELQKKGFFKNKIDYRSSEFYINLKNNDSTRKFRESLDDMKIHICKKIRPYVQNYDIINEFFKKNKGDKVENIIKNLRKEATSLVTPEIKKIKDNQVPIIIQNKLTEIKRLENDLNSLTNITIKPDEIKLKTLDCTNDCNKKKIEVYEKLNNTKETLEFYNKNLSGNIKDPISKIITRIDSLFTHNTISVSQLKTIETEKSKINKADSIIVTKIYDSIHNINIKQNTKLENKKKITNFNILNSILNLNDLVNTLSENRIGDKSIDLNTFVENDFLEIKIKNFNEKIHIINIEIDALDKTIKEKNKTTQENKKNIENKIDEEYEYIANLDEFYNNYLSSFLKSLELKTSFATEKVDSTTVSKASKIFPEIYSKVKILVNNDNIHMSDISYLDDYITAKMIELKIRDNSVNDKLYDSIITKTKIITPLLKIRALKSIQGMGDYDEDLMNLFEFIANLNKLDQAETYQSIVNMLRDGSKKVEENLTEGEFKDGYLVFINAMKKYTLINPSEEYVEIDVASFLTDLQQYYNRNNKAVFSLYLSLGLNQNFFFTNFKTSDGNTINNISFASEKIGVKWRIANFKRFEGYENVVKDDVYLNKKAPFINEFYGILYGAGLLYSVANTTTNENFDFPHIGAGLGLRFYNALDLNLIIGFPFVKDQRFGNNAFWGFGLDIPLGEYLEKLGSK